MHHMQLFSSYLLSLKQPLPKHLTNLLRSFYLECSVKDQGRVILHSRIFQHYKNADFDKFMTLKGAILTSQIPCVRKNQKRQIFILILYMVYHTYILLITASSSASFSEQLNQPQVVIIFRLYLCCGFQFSWPLCPVCRFFRFLFAFRIILLHCSICAFVFFFCIFL